MKRLLLFLAAVSIGSTGVAQQQPVTKANYDLAERFSPAKVGRMVGSTSVRPNWFRNSDKFWYTWRDSDGTKYYIVDPAAKSKHELWDMDYMAARITEITGDPFDRQHLPIERLELKEDSYFTFEIRSTLEVEKKEEPKKEQSDSTNIDKPQRPDRNARQPRKEKKTFRFRYDLATSTLTDISESDKELDYPRWASVSPDGRWAVYAKNHNLWLIDSLNLNKLRKDGSDTTIVETKLTSDGTRTFSYGGNYQQTDQNILDTMRMGVWGAWSPDSRNFALTRSDDSKIKELWVINSLSNPRPTLESYLYQMPGEEGSKEYLYVFDIDNGTNRQIAADAFKDQTIAINTRLRKNSYTYDKPRRSVWAGNNSLFYLTRVSRDLKRIDLCAVDIEADTCYAVIEERMNTYVDMSDQLWLTDDGKQIVEWSERTGWANLYLYSSDGTLKNPVTTGAMHVSEVLGIDKSKQRILFSACGVDRNENPYYNHIYSIGLDGTNMRRLDDNDCDNQVSMSDDGRYFVSNYSRVDCAPRTALYDTSGKKIMELEQTDLTLLKQAGYKFPEIFKVKAGDGVTDLWGVMYKPFDFDSTRLYPLIEYVYPGPQTEANNSQWSASMNRIDRLAQLGFVVITVGNRGGHPDRSKWYHNYGYGNLRDYGLEDKKWVAQQLAAQYPWIDGNRVGIHGHSGGGFMSTAAILKYPDFFKVAVSCAGNHDNAIYNRWWSEKHHGVKESIGEKGDTTFLYNIANNQSMAKNLKGRLLLVHGDIDNNVHPGNTIRVVDALVRANKRFDMLILPGQRHGFGDMNEYFFWRMADYFSENLLGDSQKSVDIPQLNND